LSYLHTSATKLYSSVQDTMEITMSILLYEKQNI